LALTILHTNDLHGKLSDAKLPTRLEARQGADLYFDSGDAVKSGNLAFPVGPEEVWPRLAAARCDAGVIGNRETHLLERAFLAKTSGAAHPLLCANLRRKDGTRPLPASVVLEAGGLRVAVVGVSVPMVTEGMAAKAASAFLWDAPIPSAQSEVEALRPTVDLLVVLSHIGHTQDLALAHSVEGIDLVLGGHSHTVLNEPVKVGDTWVCQGGSHARFIGRYTWSPGLGLTEAALLTWA